MTLPISYWSLPTPHRHLLSNIGIAIMCLHLTPSLLQWLSPKGKWRFHFPHVGRPVPSAPSALLGRCLFTYTSFWRVNCHLQWLLISEPGGSPFWSLAVWDGASGLGRTDRHHRRAAWLNECCWMLMGWISQPAAGRCVTTRCVSVLLFLVYLLRGCNWVLWSDADD